MKYLIIIILIGIVIYYVMKWQRPKDDSGSSKRNDRSGSGSFKTNANNQHKGSNSYAKWIGGGLGWAFGGPIGGILGLVLD